MQPAGGLGYRPETPGVSQAGLETGLPVTAGGGFMAASPSQLALHSPQISLVSQEPVLFARSITDNISYGLPTVPFEMVVEAAQKANAHGFIMELQDGYSTGTMMHPCPPSHFLPIRHTNMGTSVSPSGV